MNQEKFTMEDCYIPFKNQHIQTNIYGLLYQPEEATATHQVPAVVICHGFGSGYYRKMPYAELFARNGIACLVFDFIGSSPHTRSGGTMEDNSIRLEVDEVGVITSYMKKVPWINPDQLVLMGASMGAIVATLYISEHPDDYMGMIQIYPGYPLRDAVHQVFHDDPTQIRPLKLPNGRIQSEGITRDVWDLDLYDRARMVDCPVLIFQGTADPLVPVSYAEKALESFPHARLVLLHGEKHGFSISGMESMEDSLVLFLDELLCEQQRRESDHLTSAMAG